MSLQNASHTLLRLAATVFLMLVTIPVASAQIVPPNDDFAFAEILPPDGTVAGSNEGATKEPGEPDHAGNPGGASVWYQWTAPTDGFLTVDTLGSNFDTLLAMYVGNAVDALSELASNDDADGVQSELPNVPVTSGTIYHLAVDGFDAESGQITLTLSFFDGQDIVPPVITIVSPLDGSSFLQNTDVSAFYDCDDGPLGSGVATCMGDVPVGNLIDTSVPGAFNFTVTAADNAGNSAVAVSAYTIVEAPPAPPNDDFANAEFLVTDGTWLGTNVSATDEAGEPAHAGSGRASVWFEWAAPTDGFLTVDTFGSGFDTTLALYTGVAVDALTELASNDDIGGLQSQLPFVPVTAGTVYHLAVAGYLGATGPITLTWSFRDTDPVTNDNFADAQPLAQDDTWVGTNVTATVETGEPRHGGAGGFASIWFQWTAPMDGYLTVDTFGSNFDTVLAMYTGTAVDALTLVFANNDWGGPQSRMGDVPVTAGTVYHIAVDGWLGAIGAVTLNVSFWDGTDTTPPQITIVTPGEGATYVLNGIVPADYACEDGPLGSGVASCIGDVAVSEPIDTSTLGAHAFSVTATDVAGNSGTATANYTVSGTDTTPPVVTLSTPADGYVYAIGASITVSYDCVDEPLGTGIATCAGDLPNGAALDTSTLGSFSFSVSGTDNAGNVTTVASTYTIIVTPANDNFASAVVLAGDTGTWNGTNVGATMESGEPDHVYLPTGASIWFQWTAQVDGYFTVDTFGSNFNTVLAMYTGTSVDALTVVAENINAWPTVQSELLNVPVTAGTTYSIAVDGYFGDAGLVTLNWWFGVQFDFEPPVITLWDPDDGGVYPQGTPVWAGYSCYDPQPSSGLVSCEGPVPSGTLLDSSVPGSYSFTVTATDGAGNVATATVNYIIAANPPNDDFDDATILATEGTVSGTNVGATEVPTEPMHGGVLGGTSVWFRWTAPVDGFLSADTMGSDFDTVLAIYSGATVDALTEIDSNDDAVGAQSAVHDAPVSAGVVYSIAITGAWGDTGNYTLNWTFLELNDVTPPLVTIASPAEGDLYFEGTSVDAVYYCTDEHLGSGIDTCIGDVENLAFIDTLTSGPKTFTVTGTDNWGNVTVETVNYTVLPFTNDDFANAFPISGSGNLIAINVGATKEAGEPAHAGDPGGASVWFRWTAPRDAFLTVHTLLSPFDTTLAIYTGLSVDALTEVASNNDAVGQQSRVRDVPVTEGQTYHIAVDGVGGATGQIGLAWVEFTGPTFTEITPQTDPLWVTDLAHDFVLNAAAPADVDGDGDLDLAVIGYFVEYSVGVEERLVVFMNDGPDVDGNWIFTTQEVPMNGLFSNESDLAWGDFDGDGDPDLAVGAEGATELYRNDAGTLVPIATDLPGYQEDSNYSNAYDLRSLSWADYDNDADLDLLLPSIFDPAISAFGTALMRNDGPDGAGGWLFTEVASQLDGTVHAQTAWADHDGDGDLDLFMANVDNLLGNGFVRTYRNDNGVFTSAEPLGNLSITYGMGDWSDYDGDGDLDILVVGLVLDIDDQYKTLLRIYRNEAGVYQPETIVYSSFFPWLDLSAATWADYDNDGDVDILLTGSVIGAENIEGRSEVYVNDGGEFHPLSRNLPAPINSSGDGGAFTWFDVDGDGDLDYFVAGAYWVPNGNNQIERQMHLYRNDGLAPNRAPDAPTGMTADVTVDPAVPGHVPSGSVALSWDASFDDATPTVALTYHLELRQEGGDAGIVADRRRLPEPGNVSAVTTWSLRGLAPGTYTWTVQAVDSAFNGSPAAESSFTIGCAGCDVCGNGTIEPGEACDDGNTTGGDGCSATCQLEICGNGVIDPGEACDDGNTTGGDGCSATCQLELDPNILINGDFSAGEPPWIFFTNGGGSFDVIGGEARLSFTADGSNVQLYQHDVAAASNTGYTLSFRARHTVPNQKIAVRFARHTSPYTFYGLSVSLNLTTTMQTYSFDFTTTNDLITDGRLMFLLPRADVVGESIFVDDVVLRLTTPDTCGNGALDAGETCDGANLGGATCTTQGFDGGTLSCNATCDGFVTTGCFACGDDTINGTEVCDGIDLGGLTCSDFGFDDGTLACSPSCDGFDTSLCATCGDGTVDAGEQCDDGNAASGDGCSATCELEICGNGTLDAGEQCDDGNTTSGDGCSATCRLEGCGNGVVDAGEQCDDGNAANGDGCDAACNLEVCGNGIVQAGEQCDDGNTTSGDGCSATCRLEVCGNGTVDPGEQCDDGNTTSGDGCSATCRLEVCGNGTVDPGEQCDDGNTNDDDICSNACTINATTNEIVNGDFSAGEAPWTFWDNRSGGTFDVVAGEGRVTFGSNSTNVQLYQRGITADSSTDYTLTFRARHTGSPQRVTVRFAKHRSPYTFYGLSQQFNLTGTMQTYAVDFTTTNDVITDGRLMFLLSDADTPTGAMFVVDDVVLAPSSPSTCGNGLLDPGEACDGANLGGATCSTQGFDGGTLSCNAICDGFDTSSCFGCGNGIVDPGEVCDGSNLGGQTCQTQGFDGGTLSCYATCDDFVTTSCLICGDGTVDPGEQCDDGNTTSGDGCSATCQTEGGGQNLLVNGDFTGGTSPWRYSANGSSSFSVVGGEAFIDINTPGTNSQLYQPDVMLQPNTTYRLTFRGRNTGGDNVRVRMIRHTSPYTKYGLDRAVNLTTTMQTFTLTFTTPGGTLAPARLLMWIAPYDSAGDNYYFDDFVLEAQ